MKKTLSLRLRLTAGIVCILALALTICCTFMINASRKVLEESAISLTAREEITLLNGFSEQLSRSGSKHNDLILRYLFGSMEVQAESESTYVLQSGERHLFNNSGISPQALFQINGKSIVVDNTELISSLCTIDRNVFCVVGYNFPYYEDYYTISVVRNVTEQMSQIHELRLCCILISSVVMIAAGFFIAFFLARELRPLQNLQSNAMAIASGDYTCRVEVIQKDELGIVAESFNAMAQAVQNHVAAVEATSEERNILLHALSHEMRTPVTAISGYAYALTHMRMSIEQQAEALAFLESESRRLERLSTKLTELITVTDLQIPLNPIKAEILQSQVFSILGPMADKQGIHLEIDMGSDTLQGDCDLLVMFITNLYDNARKAGAHSVNISLKKGVLSVKDDGCGIPKGIHDKIMQPFYQGDTSRNQEGFGLGLSLCCRIAMLHGSNLTVESVPGEGSTFTTLLQLHDDSKTGQQV